MLGSESRMFGELVNNPDKLYIIRSYQRFYVWNEQKVQTYLSDIISTSERRNIDKNDVHYYGQTIFLEIDADQRGRKTYEVIDGQQRLATFLIFVACIYGKAGQLEQEFPEIKNDTQDLKNSCFKYLKSNKIGAESRPRLVLTPHDNDYFEYILTNLCSHSAVKEHKTPVSHKMLYGAQLQITTEISRLIDDGKTPIEKVKFMNDLLCTAADGFQVIVIEPKAEKYTYQLYQVVNDRGEPLKDSELLRAKSIEILSDNPEYLRKAQLIWNDVLSDSGDKTSVYLKWCYQSKVGDFNRDERCYIAYIKNYFNIQDSTKLTPEEQHRFMLDLEGLYNDILLCRKFEVGTWPFADSKLPEWKQLTLKNLIVGVHHTLCIPVLISAFRQQQLLQGKKSEDMFFLYLELCETFFILIKGVLKMREVKLKEVYLSASRELRRRPKEYKVCNFCDSLVNIETKIAKGDCLNQLRAITYHSKSDNPTLKYLCILLETYYRCFQKDGTFQKKKVPDGTVLVFKELSLEHIYPETLDAGQQDEYLNNHKHYLGNLLIYGKDNNSHLKNKLYEQKIDDYRASRFATAIDVSKRYKKWTKEEFDERQEAVCKRLSNFLLRFHT